MVETSGNGNASNLINLKRPFNNTRINASDIGTRHSDPKSIIPFGKHFILGHQNKHVHLFYFFCCISRRLTIKNEIFVLIFVVFVIKRRGQHVCFVFFWIATTTTIKAMKFGILHLVLIKKNSRIFWEGHKILENLHLTFVCIYCRQK